MTTDDSDVSRPVDDHGTDAMLAIAIQVVVAVSVWGLGGLLVDLVAGTGPWAHFLGVLLGSIVGLVLARRRAAPAGTADA